MSDTSFMEKLLDGDEVQRRSLGDVLEAKRGKRLVKSQLEDAGDFAVYQNCMTPLGYFHESNEAVRVYTGETPVARLLWGSS